MLLPFDVRADREGWTVIEVETDRACVLDGLRLVGLLEEDAEALANGLNRVAVERSGAWPAAGSGATQWLGETTPGDTSKRG
ncbi:MAG TPA: hypothetical protein VF601_23280 [Beijerinckiaceae bacterium]